MDNTKDKVLKLVSEGEKQKAQTREEIAAAIKAIQDQVLPENDVVSFAGVCVTADGNAFLGVVGEDGMLVLLGALDMLKQQILDEIV